MESRGIVWILFGFYLLKFGAVNSTAIPAAVNCGSTGPSSAPNSPNSSVPDQPSPIIWIQPINKNGTSDDFLTLTERSNSKLEEVTPESNDAFMTTLSTNAGSNTPTTTPTSGTLTTVNTTSHTTSNAMNSTTSASTSATMNFTSSTINGITNKKNFTAATLNNTSSTLNNTSTATNATSATTNATSATPNAISATSNATLATKNATLATPSGTTPTNDTGNAVPEVALQNLTANTNSVPVVNGTRDGKSLFLSKSDPPPSTNLTEKHGNLTTGAPSNTTRMEPMTMPEVEKPITKTNLTNVATSTQLRPNNDLKNATVTNGTTTTTTTSIPPMTEAGTGANSTSEIKNPQVIFLITASVICFTQNKL